TGDYVQQHVDLSDYAGVTIQVAFRHYDVTDQFSVNIDQVEVTTGGDIPVETPTPIVTDEPVTDEPVTDEPVTDEPVTDEPVTDVPVTDEPVTDEPVTDEPVTDAPVTDAPVTDEPNPPTPPTGTIALVGIGVAAVLAGAGIVLFRKKED
ncbi:MAG: LPXTG cell wall anchor domain-containing protein, partial [Clostridium sp.]|nr:LPXTG cell wall anchor domain-containing protein [Clostridium sp.]